MMKFRRLKTMVKKMVELADNCSVKVNVFVLDPKFVKITEYYSDEQVKLENISKQIDDAKKGPKPTRTRKVLQVRSINARDRLAETSSSSH